MPVNFPNNPSNGDTHKVNNVTYTYVTASNKWKPGTVSTPSTGLDSAAVNSLISATPSSGTTTYDSIGALPLTGNSAGDIAFIDSADRLFVYNGAGWYSISLVNATPTISSVVDSDGGTTPFTLSTEGATTVITITAFDSDGTPPTLTYDYSVTSGSLTNGGGTTATVVQDSSDTNVFRITPTTTEAYAGDFTLTFTASDGINTGTSANQFSLAFSVVNSNYTTSLIKADTSSNDNQVDASSNSFTITENGNVTSRAITPYHPKGYSAYHVAATSRYYTGNSSDFDLSGNDWSYEGWIYVPGSHTLGSYIRGFGLGPYYGNSKSFMILIADGENSGNITAIWDDGTLGRKLISTTAFEKGQWNHLAVCKSGNSIGLFYNGTRIASNDSYTGSVSSGDTYAYVGHTGNDTEGFVGWSRDIRLVNGSSAYDASASSITVPTESLTAITNTKLLVTGRPYIADQSNSSHSFTLSNIRSNQFGPYDHDRYTKSAHGGSVYFDGNGDYLQVASSTNFGFDADFTVEFWLYYTGGNGYKFFWNNNSQSGDYIGYGLNTNTLNPWLWNDADIVTTSTAIKTYTWQHHAVVRNGSTISIYLDGKSIGSATDSTNFGTGTQPMHIGWNGINNDQNTTGYISDFRVVKGTAVYTADFTPPTSPLTAITNTQLLTCTNKHEVWDEGSSYSVLNGNATASNTQTKYSDSIAVDGTDDGVLVAAVGPLEQNVILHNDFTVEFWAYPTSWSTSATFLSLGHGSSYAPFTIYYYSGESELSFFASSTGSTWNLESITATGITPWTNSWKHFAMTYDTSATTVKLWLDGTLTATYTGIDGWENGGTATYWTFATNENNQAAFAGYIEDIRITNGLVRYTSAFTPPSAALKG